MIVADGCCWFGVAVFLSFHLPSICYYSVSFIYMILKGVKNKLCTICVYIQIFECHFCLILFSFACKLTSSSLLFGAMGLCWWVETQIYECALQWWFCYGISDYGKINKICMPHQVRENHTMPSAQIVQVQHTTISLYFWVWVCAVMFICLLFSCSFWLWR